MNHDEAEIVFEKLMQLHDSGDSDLLDAELAKLRSQNIEIAYKVTQLIEWLDSEDERFDKFPLVTQECQISLCGHIVLTDSREFGIELADYTHTGLGGEFERIELEPFEFDNFIEAIGLDIDWPEVPVPNRIIDDEWDDDEDDNDDEGINDEDKDDHES